MFIIVGLGNPGREYRETRHNVGFQVIDKLAEAQGISVTRAKFQALYGEGRIGKERVLLVKPMTYMNQSGVAVRQILDFYKADLNNCLVIFDDVDIPFGQLRFRANGSGGSHNGMKSIIQHLKSQEFPRLKIGIGSKKPQQDLADFVLSKFRPEEIDESVLWLMV